MADTDDDTGPRTYPGEPSEGHRKKAWPKWVEQGVFVLGLTLISLLLGMFVGTTRSTVAGVAITAIFGLMASVVTLQLKGEGSQAFIGTAMIFIAVGTALGVVVGVRFREHPIPSGLALPRVILANTDCVRPHDCDEATADMALSWIVVRERLLETGYKEADVNELYRRFRGQDIDPHVLELFLAPTRQPAEPKKD